MPLLCLATGEPAAASPTSIAAAQAIAVAPAVTAPVTVPAATAAAVSAATEHVAPRPSLQSTKSNAAAAQGAANAAFIHSSAVATDVPATTLPFSPSPFTHSPDRTARNDDIERPADEPDERPDEPDEWPVGVCGMGCGTPTEPSVGPPHTVHHAIAQPTTSPPTTSPGSGDVGGGVGSGGNRASECVGFLHSDLQRTSQRSLPLLRRCILPNSGRCKLAGPLDCPHDG